MRRSFASLIVLFLALTAPSLAQSEADGAVQYFDVGLRFVINCTLPPPTAADAAITWEANGTAVEKIPRLAERVKLLERGAYLQLSKPVQEDWGNYTCRAGSGPAATIAVLGHPHLKMADDAAAVEGQALRLVCRVQGLPHPEVTWLVSTNGSAAVPVLEGLAGRAAVAAHEGVAGAALTVNDTALSDAGNYTCLATTADGVSRRTHTTVRVKDKYAAVWPFLGICAEVVVLCAAILLYERRRTKPDLDDSDTDHHEQKKS